MQFLKFLKAKSMEKTAFKTANNYVEDKTFILKRVTLFYHLYLIPDSGFQFLVLPIKLYSKLIG